MKQKWLYCIAVFYYLVSSSIAMAATEQDYQNALSHWQAALQQVVNSEGQIDFIALANKPSDLRKFVSFIGKVSPQSDAGLFPSKADKLAYHLNAYNALAMHAVIARSIPTDFSNFFKRWIFFKLHPIVVGGQKTSLYDYENDVIRPLGEAKVHFALNCMVRDCPRLPTKPFYPETVNQHLTELSIEFFNKDKHVIVDEAEETVYVSEILDFYTEDFISSGRKNDLIAYVNRFRQQAIPSHYQLDFIDYDWTVNQQQN